MASRDTPQRSKKKLAQNFGKSDAMWFIFNKFKHYTIFPGVTVPGAHGSIITLKLDSGYKSFLPKRWFLEIGYLY